MDDICLKRLCLKYHDICFGHSVGYDIHQKISNQSAYLFHCIIGLGIIATRVDLYVLYLTSYLLDKIVNVIKSIHVRKCGYL